jgi:hypothetical protein
VRHSGWSIPDSNVLERQTGLVPRSALRGSFSACRPAEPAAARRYHRSVTQSDDHGTLPAHAERMLSRLEGIEGLTVHGRAAHMQHMDHAKRVRQLADHLRAVLLGNDAGRYASALVVVRAALEHHLMDRLLFLGNRYIETYTGIKKEEVAAEAAKLAALQAGDRPDIARWWWDDSGMNVVFRGLHTSRSKKGRGQTLSPYYFRIDNFDPFTGGKKHGVRLAAPFWQRAHREDRAAESAAAWRRYFTYDRIRKNLDVNRLLPRMGLQVDVHYAFLSGFAHPSKRGYEAIYGRNDPDRIGSFDHYASELALLYVITIAAAELETYGRMARRAPRLGLSRWEDVESEVRDARVASGYFWFLGGEPTTLDRIDTAHTPPGGTTPKWGRPRVDPSLIRSTSVRYYADPLGRLARLHQGFQEISTGLAYRSPFERPDASRRT